jgi:uncharacterized repeat protein (TIGR01451 family)
MIAPQNLTAWDKIRITDIITDPLHTDITYDVLNAAQTPITGLTGIRPNNDGYINISGLSVNSPTNQIYLRANLYRDTPEAPSPIIDKIVYLYATSTPPFISFDAVVNSSAASLSDYTIHNTATISTTTPEINENNNTGIYDISVIHTDLSTTLSVDKSAAGSGDAVKYTYEYLNDGVDTALNARLKLTLPTQVSSISGTVAGLTSLGRTLTCTTNGYQATAIGNANGTAATINYGGLGYTSAPIVTVSGGLCTTLPTATATVTG